jgi:hypothetical protein
LAEAPAARAHEQYRYVLESNETWTHFEDEFDEVVKQPIPWVTARAVTPMATEPLAGSATQETGQLALS